MKNLPGALWPQQAVRDPDNARTVCAVSLFVFFAAVYAVSRNHSYPFDSVLFANMIEIPILRIPADLAFEWNHFLWYPTGRLFYLALHYAGISLRGYEALQLLNAIVGAAGVTVTFLTLSRVAIGLWTPLAWSLISGLSAVYWVRSAGAENYLFGTFCAICFCYYLLSYWREPSDRNMVLMAVSSVLSAYYHLGNIAIVGAALVAVLIRRRADGFRTQLLNLSLLLTILWVPYAYVHHWFEPGGFSRWWVWSKGLADGYAPLQHPTGGFESTVVQNIPATVQTFIKSVLWFDSWNAATIARLAALFLLGLVAVFYDAWKIRQSGENDHNQAGLDYIFLIPFLTLTGLYALWQPRNPIYWSVNTAMFFLFAGAMALGRRGGRMFSIPGSCLVLIIALLSMHNLRAVILPDKTNPRQFVVNAALKIGQITPAESPILVSGRGGQWGFFKVYLPYFAHRNRLAVDLFAMNAIVQNRDPIVRVQQVIAAELASGIPVYVMEDTLQGKVAFADFGLSPERIESIWKPYNLLPISDFPGNPSNRMYMFWSNTLPKEAQNAISARLKLNGLLDQQLMVYKERSREDKSKELADEISALEASLFAARKKSDGS